MPRAGTYEAMVSAWDKKSLCVITWNVGSTVKRLVHIISLLSLHEPHIFVLQECNLLYGAVHACRDALRPMGYEILSW